MKILRQWPLVLAAIVPIIAIVEIAGNVRTADAVPPMSAFRPAAQILRTAHRPGDLVVFAPAWMSQTRVALGEWMTIADQARGDTFDYPRVWELALDGYHSPDVAGLDVIERHELDRLTLTLYRNPDHRPAVWRAYEEVRSGRVTVGLPGGEQACPWDERQQRHSCAGPTHEPWVWVGPYFMTDVQFRPRFCLWAHPTERGPVHVRFDDVPTGTTLVVHTGLTYGAYRDPNRGSVFADTEIDGRHAGRIENAYDVGWTTAVYDVPPGPDRRTVRISISTRSQGMRHFCFDATMRVEAPAESTEPADSPGLSP